MRQAGTKVVAGSACDLSPEQIEALGVTIVPRSVSFGPEVFYVGQPSDDEHWEKARGPLWPQTSQPSAGAFEGAFARQIDAGYEVVCASLLSRNIGAYSTALAAASRFGDSVSRDRALQSEGADRRARQATTG